MNKKFYIAVLTFCISFVGNSAEPLSLSCSKNGTLVLYVNGVLNTLEETTLTFRRISSEVESITSRLDAKADVDVDFYYNTSEGVFDLTQLVRQKLANQKRYSLIEIDELVSSYIFEIEWFVQKVGLPFFEEIQTEWAKKVQDRISEIDVQLLALRIQAALIFENKKVIVVSHSQGNIYANRAYDLLVNEMGVREVLALNYGNLQLASVANRVSAKNFRYITHDDDKALNYLRNYNKPVLRPNFITNCPGADSDVLCHEVVRTYLSNISANGKKQGFGRVYRSFAQIFKDSLEEVAWMLGNNDSSCCNGADGRFYRENYNSESQGFISKNVIIDKKGKLHLPQNRQLCSDIYVKSMGELSVSDSSTVLNKLEVGEYAKVSVSGMSEINGNVIVNSNSSLDVSEESNVTGDLIIGPKTNVVVTEGSQIAGKVMLSNLGATNSEVFVTEYSGLVGTERIETIGDILLEHSYLSHDIANEKMTLSNSSKSFPLHFQDSYVNGPSSFDGPIMLKDVGVYQRNEISGHGFQSPTEQFEHFPELTNLDVVNGNKISGFYIVEKSLFNGSEVQGKTKIKNDNTWASTYIGAGVWAGLNNVKIIDHVTVNGHVGPGSYLKGEIVQNNSNGVIINENFDLKAVSRVTGSVVFDSGSFWGHWVGGINAQGYSGFVTGSVIENSPTMSGDIPQYNRYISGAPVIENNSFLTQTNVSGTPHIKQSNLLDCNVTCDADVVDEGEYQKFYGCGYSSYPPITKSLRAYDSAIRKSENKFEQARLRNKKRIERVHNELDELRRAYL